MTNDPLPAFGVDPDAPPDVGLSEQRKVLNAASICAVTLDEAGLSPAGQMAAVDCLTVVYKQPHLEKALQAAYDCGYAEARAGLPRGRVAQPEGPAAPGDDGGDEDDE